ncbi:hypothetical protein BHE74_00026897 [Ensete ventricosum]|nr:hypothetical protein BHE74_00026897 [Ensete ventricosum]
MVTISFTPIQEERLNQDARRTRTTPRLETHKPLAPPAPSHPSLSMKLTRQELRDRSTKDLRWHFNELWSCNHSCKKGKLPMIEPIEESEEDDLEPKEENMKEDPQLVDCMTHTLADHANPQAMKVKESLKQQLITIFIETRSTNNFMNSKVAT